MKRRDKFIKPILEECAIIAWTLFVMLAYISIFIIPKIKEAILR